MHVHMCKKQLKLVYIIVEAGKSEICRWVRPTHRKLRSSVKGRISSSPGNFRSLIFRTFNLLNDTPMTMGVKNPPARQETEEMQVRPLGQGDPLEEGMATHSSILAWRIPWPEEPRGLHTSKGLQRVGHNWATTHTCTLMRMIFF